MSRDELPKAEDCNCLAFRQAARHVSQFYDRFLAPTGLRTTQFSILAKTTGKVPVKLTKAGFALVKGAKKRTMKATVTVTMASGQTFTHVITLKA